VLQCVAQHLVCYENLHTRYDTLQMIGLASWVVWMLCCGLCTAICGTLVCWSKVCYSVVQYVAVLCSVLQRVALCCSVLQTGSSYPFVALWCAEARCVAVLFNVLQCVQCIAVRCSALQRVAACCSVLQVGSAQPLVALWGAGTRCVCVCVCLFACVCVCVYERESGDVYSCVSV